MLSASYGSPSAINRDKWKALINLLLKMISRALKRARVSLRSVASRVVKRREPRQAHTCTYTSYAGMLAKYLIPLHAGYISVPLGSCIFHSPRAAPIDFPIAIDECLREGGLTGAAIGEKVDS